MGRRAEVLSTRLPLVASAALLAMAAVGVAMGFQTGTIGLTLFLAVVFPLTGPILRSVSRWRGRGEPPDWWGAHIEHARREAALIAGIAAAAAIALLVWSAVEAVF